jgi:hypothetical protein
MAVSAVPFLARNTQPTIIPEPQKFFPRLSCPFLRLLTGALRRGAHQRAMSKVI